MKMTAVLTLFLVLCSGLCLANDDDDTLKRWLSKSDLVLSGTIVSEPVGLIEESGVPNYICEFKVFDVCKGNAKLMGKTIQVNIQRFEMDKKDRHPLIKKGAECILFLKKGAKETPPRTTSDFWFGIQHPMPAMVRSLKRLAQQEEKKGDQKNARVHKKWREEMAKNGSELLDRRKMGRRKNSSDSFVSSQSEPKEVQWKPSLLEGGYMFKDAQQFGNYVRHAQTVATGVLTAWDGSKGEVRLDSVFHGKLKDKSVPIISTGGIVHTKLGDRVIFFLAARDGEPKLHSFCGAAGIYKYSDDLAFIIKKSLKSAD